MFANITKPPIIKIIMYIKCLLKNLLTIFIVFFNLTINAQNVEWAFVKGNGKPPFYPTFGTKGTSSTENYIGSLEQAVSWKLGNKIYFFGGGGYSNVTFQHIPRRSDNLWMYDTSTELWTFLGGNGVTPANKGTYGTKGVYASSNSPGARINAVGWVSDSKLYLFGGNGYEGVTANSIGMLNDLWEYDPSINQWKWLSGENTISQTNNYGIIGVEATTNYPSAREGSNSWVYNQKLYLFGGVNNNLERYNDLWVFDLITENWTWISGTNTVNNEGSYGTKNLTTINNLPPSRYDSNSAIYNDKFILFGGNGDGNSRFNDLWEYNVSLNQWTWISGSNIVDQFGNYGVINTPSNANNPGGRKSSSLILKDNNLYLFGGNGYSENSNGFLNDIWSFNLLSKEWKWLKGSKNNSERSSHGDSLVANSSNKVGARYGSSIYETDNKLYLLGGYGYSSKDVGVLNDFWEYDLQTNNFRWLRGNIYTKVPQIFGTIGVEDEKNTPFSGTPSAQWGVNGKLYLFGSVNDRGNQLWVYDTSTNNYTFLKGSSSADALATFGTKNMSDANNNPGGREYAGYWAYGNKLYLFGGYGFDGVSHGLLNDLWEYDIASNRWTWVGGNNTRNTAGVYGTLGVKNSSNYPGARTSPYVWQSGSKVYMFGGEGKAVGFTEGWLNDLWEFDHLDGSWTWIKGSNQIDKSSIYGTINVSSSSNNPGGRQGSSGFITNGKLYLFGGFGITVTNSFGRYNDLWEFDLTTKNWTWIKGNVFSNMAGRYGIKGTSASNNTPGSRTLSSFFSINNEFYLFGGNGIGNTGTTSSYLNDLWKFNVNTKNWTWIGGSNIINPSANYSERNKFSVTNWIGGTVNNPNVYVDNNKAYIFSGSGNGFFSDEGYKNDLWILKFLETSLPIKLKDFAAKREKDFVSLDWSTISELNNSHFILSYSSDNLTFNQIATINGSLNSNKLNTYNYHHKNPIIGNNYYRLSQVDLNGEITELGIRAVKFDLSGSHLLTIHPNPIEEVFYLTLQSNVSNQLEITITDIFGKTIYSTNLKTQADKEIYEIKLDSRLKSGTYIIKAKGENFTESIKILAL